MPSKRPTKADLCNVIKAMQDEADGLRARIADLEHQVTKLSAVACELGSIAVKANREKAEWQAKCRF